MSLGRRLPAMSAAVMMLSMVPEMPPLDILYPQRRTGPKPLSAAQRRPNYWNAPVQRENRRPVKRAPVTAKYTARIINTSAPQSSSLRALTLTVEGTSVKSATENARRQVANVKSFRVGRVTKMIPYDGLRKVMKHRGWLKRLRFPNPNHS